MTYDNFEPFNAEEHKQESSFELLPVGQYEFAVTKTDMKPTKDNGQMLNLQCTVQSGEYQGRIVFVGLFMVAPPNATEGQIKAVKIAKATLGDICRAVGKATIASPDDLLGIPFMGDVVVEPGKNGYEDRNKIKKFIAKGANTPAAAPVQAGPWAK